MSAEQYAKHLEVVKKASHRAGIDVSDAGESDLEAIGTLETILRVNSPEGKELSDLPKAAYSADFYGELRRRFFGDYLDYRKMYLSLSLDEYIGDRYGLPEAKKTVVAGSAEGSEDSGSDSDSDSFDDEVFPEDSFEGYEGTGLVLYTVPYGIDDDGYDIWSDPDIEAENRRLEAVAQAKEDKFRSLEFAELSIDEVLAPPVEGSDNKLGSLAFDPIGVDSEGYDQWHEPAYDGEEIDLDSDDDVSEVVESTESESKESKESGPYGTHGGVDGQGYDVWTVAEAEPEVETVVESVDESTDDALADTVDEPVISGNWKGIDELGYDIWAGKHEPEVAEPNNFDTEDDQDGFDHSNDPERDVLGTLQSKWIGETPDGYDLWETGDQVEPSIADVTDPLDELKSPHYGIDSNGYDIWVSPVAPSSTSNGAPATPVSSNRSHSNTRRVPPNEVTYTDANIGEAITVHAPLSREDQLLDVVDQAISGIFQFGKRFAGSNNRKNRSRSR